MDASTPAALPRKRRRPPVSCVQCRRRKVKCDRAVPCSQCTRSKHSACTYDPDDPPVRRPKAMPSSAGSSSIAVPLSPASSRPNDLPDITPNTSNSHTPSSSSHTTAPTFDPDKWSKLSWQAQDHIAEPCSTRTGPSDQVPLDSDDYNHGDKVNESSAFSGQSYSSLFRKPSSVPRGLSDIRGIVSKGRLYGQSHWANGFEPFEAISKLKSHFDYESTELGELLKKCKSLARVTKSSYASHFSHPTDFTSYIPSREIADLLVENYFRTFESTYRILHRPSFYQEFSRYWSNPSAEANTNFVVKLLLVMSIGTCFHLDSTLRSLAPQWIHTAQSFLGSPYEKGRLNISGLQIHCLLIVAKQTTNGVGGDLVWSSVGSALRNAINMGYHLDPKHFPRMTILHSEMRRRLWATVVELNLQASIDSGMPPLLSWDDFDCGPPSNIDDHDIIDEHTQVAPISKPEGVFTQTSIQLALARSFRTRLTITCLINSFRRELTYDETLKLGSELTSHLRHQTTLFQDSHSQQSSDTTRSPTALQKNVLDLLTRRFLVALHLPFAILARTEPRYYFSRKLVLDCATINLSYTGDSDSEEDDYTRLKIQAGGEFREAMVRSAMIIGLELHLSFLEESGPSSHAVSAREPLHKIMADIVAFSKRRVEAGETNVQGYFWLSVIKAQLDAIEAGVPVTRAVQDTALNVITKAHEILKERAAAISTVGTPVAEIAVEWEGFGWDLSIQDTSGPSDFNLDAPNSWFSQGLESDYGMLWSPE